MAFRSLMILLCVGACYTANAAQNGVLTTHHGATEHGACMLPEASYIVTKPVALGDIGSLGPLKYKNGMCGKILRVDCGNGPLDVIVSNSNLGGGLDLYKSSWNQATKNAQPGQKWCRVELTNQNAIRGHGPPLLLWAVVREKQVPTTKNRDPFSSHLFFPQIIT